MTYLYGDSTPSPLTTNVIDFLRRAFDASVRIIQAEERMLSESTAQTRREKAASELVTRLEELGRGVVAALDPAASATSGSHVARLRESIMRAAHESVAREVADVKAILARDGERSAQARVDERRRCVSALEALLIQHDLPEMRCEIHLELSGGTRYTARLRGTTEYGIEVLLELEVPPGSLFESDVRVQQVADGLEIHAPETGGFFRKETRMVSHKVGKLHVSSVTVSPDAVKIKLRATTEGGAGYDIGVDTKTQQVEIARTGKDDGDLEVYPVAEADVPQILGLSNKLLAAVEPLKDQRRGLVMCTVDGKSLMEHDRPTVVVERMMYAVAPAVKEIAAHSQSHDELVLRRQIGENRREEIFVKKAELLAILADVSSERYRLFESLGLGQHRPRAASQPAELPAVEIDESWDDDSVAQELSVRDALPVRDDESEDKVDEEEETNVQDSRQRPPTPPTAA